MQKVSETGTKSESTRSDGLYLALFSLHGLVRADRWELGRDADTGGQIRYVVEMAKALGEHPQVDRVDLFTRSIFDSRVDTAYALPSEKISDTVTLRRIAFGPKRYLHKERLWPYFDFMVDQMIAFFRREGRIPDILHGHYADGGQVGGQLARLLGIPFIFTGHSLGRVKRQRLLDQGKEAGDIDKRYALQTRIEAEEFALETASKVVASTFQEIEDQYQHYDHYVPERMEVIPPGVDLSAFSTKVSGSDFPEVKSRIHRFLEDPDKPMILAMARPDERKNLEKLVHVYGQSAELREQANLVLILGARTDIREMAPGQQKVMKNLLTLIDTYDLYGKVAYPKEQDPSDVPAIYRLAAKSQGIFVNIALTEPFGLTLLEAGASGLPVVATKDGGPVDIIANCKHGLLVDPLDSEAIENALLRALEDRAEYARWADSGIDGTRKHYSWSTHVDRYMRSVLEIHEQSRQPENPFAKNRQRHLANFDRLLITDIDNTLTGDDEGLAKLVETLEKHGEQVGFGIATGRSFDDVIALIDKLPIPAPDLIISSAGTALHYGPSRIPDRTWDRHIRHHWNPASIKEVLSGIEGVDLQDANDQSATKISYQIDPAKAPSQSEIRRLLRSAGLRTKVILSHGIFLDVIPSRAGSGLCIRHLSMKWGFPFERLLVAGDSGNDEEMLRGGTLGIVVGNYSSELRHLRTRPRIHFSQGAHAWGVLEGLEYYDFLGSIRIPNDHTTKTPVQAEGETHGTDDDSAS